MNKITLICSKWIFAIGLLASLLSLGCSRSSSSTVVLATSAPVSEIEEQIDAFNELHPDIRVELMFLGVGEMTTRIHAESKNPQIDVAYDLPLHYIIRNLDSFRSYVAQKDEEFLDAFKDGETHKWYGNYLGPQVFLVNTNLVPDAKEKITSWKDLAKPEFRGEIIIANPALSSSTFEQLQIMIKVGGWELVKRVLENAIITSSSRLVYQGVADGEYSIGMVTENISVNLMEEDYPVVPIYPKEGTNEQIIGIGMIKNSPNQENAELLLEFLISREAHQISASAPYFRRSVRSDVDLHPRMVKTEELKFVLPIKDILTVEVEKHEAILDRFDKLMSEM